MNLDISYLSRQESNIIKGILIILIVLGHNGILMGNAPGLEQTTLYRYLYKFHVYGFLFLPFLYNVPKNSISRIKKNFFHLYKPYTFAFIILLAANILLTKHSPSIPTILLAYIAGNEPLLNAAVGARFLWFIPAMFFLLILRDSFLRNKSILVPLTVVSMALLFLNRFYVISFYDIYEYTILGIWPAVTYFGAAVILRLIIPYSNNKIARLTYVMVAIISSIIFFLTQDISYNYILKYLVMFNNEILLLFIIFLAIITIAKALTSSKISKIFEYLGTISLEIYIIHVFIYNLCLFTFIKFDIPLSLVSGIFALIITISLSVFFTHIAKNTKAYKFIFK